MTDKQNPSKIFETPQPNAVAPTIKPDKPGHAMRFNKGKAKLSFIFDFPFAVTAFARVCEGGAVKYSLNDWKKGRPIRDTEDSLLRHCMLFHNGENLDPELVINHMANVMWNAASVIEFLSRGDKTLDDRDKTHPIDLNQLHHTLENLPSGFPIKAEGT